MADLSIDVEGYELTAEWTDENPETRAAIEAALPVSGEASRWGEELYFRTPVDVAEENPREEVPVGAVAYWPQGNAICLFWGPTPASVDENPRAAGPVNVVAIVDDVEMVAEVDGDATVSIRRG